MFRRNGTIVFVLLIFLLSGVGAQNLWPEITSEMKPWTRWWWMGSAVDEKNLEQAITELASVGFGGVEVTPIYGAKGFEDQYLEFLSDEWLDMLSFTIAKGKEVGLGVDINLGTGWPFGGPNIEVEQAATKMIIDEWELVKGESIHFPLKPKKKGNNSSKLQALRAFQVSDGKEINLDRYVNREKASWKAPEDVLLIGLFSSRTGQKVKRAAPGGEGFTLDHLGKKSVQHYFSRFRDAFYGRNLELHNFFNDSYEVYGANWTDDFLDEFKNRKGYALEDHLLELSGRSSDIESIKRIKSDYREIINELLRDRFLIPFTEFANSYGAKSRNQAHGSPGNLIDLYASTDIPETETFGSSSFDIPGLKRDSADVRNVDPDPMMFKFATSAAHTTGKKLISAESFTWLTEHFKTSLAQIKPEAEQLFLTGVNHLHYHGTTYSPYEVPFPGWLFYASVEFVPYNPLWSHMRGMNKYFSRVQSILQSTKPDNDLLIYWPIYDIWQDHQGSFKQLTVHNIDQWLYPTDFYKKSQKLQKAGFSFDFISDAILSEAKVKGHKIMTSDESTPYKAIYVPSHDYFSEKTFETLLNFAHDGAKIIFEVLPEDVPGWAEIEERKNVLENLKKSLVFRVASGGLVAEYGEGKIYLTTNVERTLENEKVFPERIVNSGLQYIRRVSDENHYYYLVNHTAETVDEFIKLNKTGRSYSLLDPQTGRTYKLIDELGSVRIQIPSGYSWVLLVSDIQEAIETFPYRESKKDLILLDNQWDVKFIEGGPELPKAREIDQLTFWTDWNDEIANNFSGLAVYETRFNVKKQPGKSYLLELNEVAESVRVIVNGEEAGIIWANPYQLEIGQWLREGENTLQLEVANLMANRVRDLDKRGVDWRNYHEINFVNIDYKNFDASKWEIADSGLNGFARIVVY